MLRALRASRIDILWWSQGCLHCSITQRGACFSAGGNGPVTSRACHQASITFYFLGSALQSRDAEEQEQRHRRYASASCRSRTGGKAQKAENLQCKWVAPFWGTSSKRYRFVPLVVLLHLSSGRSGELGHRAGSLCRAPSHPPKKGAIQVPAGSFHFSLPALTVLSQGNCRFGLLLVPLLRGGFPGRVGHGSAAARRSGASSAALPGANSHKTWFLASGKSFYF